MTIRLERTRNASPCANSPKFKFLVHAWLLAQFSTATPFPDSIDLRPARVEDTAQSSAGCDHTLQNKSHLERFAGTVNK